MDSNGRQSDRPNRLKSLRSPPITVFPQSYLSRSLHSVHPSTDSWQKEAIGRGCSLTRSLHEESKDIRSETRPVVRRRKFHQHRKSVTLDPSTGLILSRGALPSSSSSSDEEQERPKLRGPSARRFSRRSTHRAHLSMHCLPLSPPIEDRSKSLSVVDLVDYEDDDATDFSSQASVSRWTSRILAELESLPGSRLNVSSPTPPPPPPHRSQPSPSSSLLSSSLHASLPPSRNSTISNLSLSSVDTLKEDERAEEVTPSVRESLDVLSPSSPSPSTSPSPSPSLNSSERERLSKSLLYPIEDDSTQLIRSIQRLSMSLYPSSSHNDDSSSLPRWQSKVSCLSKTASSSLDTPPPSVDSVVASLLRAVDQRKRVRRDAETQTTPPPSVLDLSRSSSFDYLSHPSPSLTRRKDDSSSGEEVDREVRRLNEVSEGKMRLEQTLEDGLAFLLHQADEGTSKSSGEERRGPAKVIRRSSTMSESVYDNVHSERSPDDESDDCRPSPPSCSPPRSSPPSSSPPSDSKQLAVSSSSDFSRAEDRAVEACRWLRSAGFPQYAHAFEEGKFPLQLESVLSDHQDILDSDSVQALSKRITALNRCAIMRMDGVVLRERGSLIGTHNEHAEDDGVALSARWRYQRHSQSWSRTGDLPVIVSRPPMSPRVHKEQREEREEREPRRENSMLQRSHSERIKERAKAMIKRMDVRPKRKEDSRFLISDPVLLSFDSATTPSAMNQLQGRINRLSNSRLVSRSKSTDRRQGMIFGTPSSPDSSDDSSVRLSRYGEAAPVRSLARDMSVPSRTRDTVRRELPSPHDYLFPSRLRPATPTVSSPLSKRRGLDAFASPSFDRRSHRNNNVPVYSHEVSSDGYSRVDSSPLLNVDTVDNSEDERVRDGQRRDSGVGSSLSRSPSAPCARLRQSVLTSSLPLTASFSSSTTSSLSSWSRKRPSALPMKESTDLFLTDQELSIAVDSLNVVETSKLRKLAYLKVTASLEKHMAHVKGETLTLESPQIQSKQWTVQRILRKIKNIDGKHSKEDSVVFGHSLSTIRKRTGLALPRSIFEIIRFLRIHAAETVGMFRKNGVKSRIGELRLIADRESDGDVFVDENTLSATQVHDVADLLKQYLRELPEPLMTNSLSKTFSNIHEHIPEEERLSLTRLAVVLLPEENREALQTLLFFFADVAKHADTNNMPADNLSVCLAPSLFQLSASRLNTVTASRRHKTIGGTGMPTEAEMRETRAAQSCLSHMIKHATQLFLLNEHLPKEVKVEYEMDSPLYKSLGGHGGPRNYMLNRVRQLIREHDERWKGWIVEGTVEGVEMSSKKSSDGHPLNHYRVWTDCDAPPKTVLARIAKERYVWDPSFINCRCMETISPDMELFQYVLNDSVGHPTRDCFVLRMQRAEVTEVKGAAVLVERSVECSETQLLGGITAAVLDSRFLIEPHQGRSRVTHVSRVDLRGRSPSWYSTFYLHLVAHQLARLRSSFKHPIDDSRETKV